MSVLTPMRPTDLRSPTWAIPSTTVQKMIGAISILISLMKPSASGRSHGLFIGREHRIQPVLRTTWVCGSIGRWNLTPRQVSSSVRCWRPEPAIATACRRSSPRTDGGSSWPSPRWTGAAARRST
ncbi:Uncharacterised protein [Mycobacteroides abscessus subsp. abscessus]|nr:Uncharacterised protein [Mycobacteroides abscessus subsp. abscessus]